MNLAFGWRRDLPDFRDYTDEHSSIKSILDKSEALKRAEYENHYDIEHHHTHFSPLSTVPPRAHHDIVNAVSPQAGMPLEAVKSGTSVNLRPWCSPVEDQGNLGSCTANACVGLVEYYQNRAFGKYLNASRLFVYKATRNLLGFTGDSGAYLRSTMKALTLFGVPPEQYWAYNVSKFDTEPPAFAYAFADNYKAIKYYRLDNVGMTPDQVLASVKTKIAAGLPCAFGFSVYSSISNSPDIPFPKARDTLLGGHAVCAVGFDVSRKIGSDTGALLIRNSWGTSWGDQGYGWLPFTYVTRGLSSDFWNLIQESFVDTDIFK